MSRAHVDPGDLEAVRRAVGLDEDGSRLHDVGLRRIGIGPDALDELPAVVDGLRRPGPIAIVADTVTIQRAGVDAKEAVAERLAALEPGVTVIRLGEPGMPLHADAEAIEAAVAGATGCGCLVSVGSGTICDIGKEASRLLGVPYVVVQTANSVNAFSDDMAVLLVNGVKRTMPSRWPDALVVDLGLVRDAPPILNRAGVGELAAMYTAPADWRLASAFGMDDTFDRRVVDLFRDGRDELVSAAPRASDPDDAAQRTLAELMTLSGLALGIAGRTAPISGTEHTVSHLLEMAAAQEGRPAGLHGAQVGVAALAVAVAWDRVLATLDPERLLATPVPSDETMRARTDDAFDWLDPSGAMADECWSQYRRKLVRWRERRAGLRALVDGWGDLREELRTWAAPAATVAGVLGSS
ncbi:MAG TPA: iron-containing alcohol dehydrogenase, partial [Candidatus Limnocylindrales bacterium]